MVRRVVHRVVVDHRTWYVATHVSSAFHRGLAGLLTLLHGAALRARAPAADA